VRAVVHAAHGDVGVLERAGEAQARLESGLAFGKIVLLP
jgi:hypothetical protein